MAKLNDELVKWLKKKSFREISLKPHCHGVRLTLKENFEEVVDSVQDNLQDALEDCLKRFDEGKNYLIKRKLDYANNRVKELNNELKRKRIEVKQLKNEMQKRSRKK